MVPQMALLPSFPWLKRIPFHSVCTTHSIHSSVNGHLGCFHCEQCCREQIGVRVSFPNYSFVQIHTQEWDCRIMLLLLSRFGRVRLCATP